MAELDEPLTERELEVVRLVAEGLSNKEIGARLFVSPNTVRVHLRNIFAKLGAQSRTEVTIIAVRNGWVKVEAVPPALPQEDEFSPRPSSEEVQTALAEAASAAPPQPVPVAPDPLPPAPLAVWQRVALVGVLACSVALTVWAVRDARPLVVAQPQVANFDDLLTSSSTIAEPTSVAVENSRWFARASIRSARARAATAVVNGRLYIIGGEVNGQPAREVLVYEPQADAWREGPAKPTPTMNAGAAALGNVIYVPGGTLAGQLISSQFEALYLERQAWMRLADLPIPLAGHAVAAAQGQIVVAGGRTSNGLNDRVLSFDPASGKWKLLSLLPTPRSQLALIALGERLFAVGGYDGQRELATCEYLDLQQMTWARCAPMLLPRGGLGVVEMDGQLYAIGGGIVGYIGFNERYDPIVDRWRPVEMPAQRMGEWRNMSVARIGYRIYAVGGSTRGVLLSDNYAYEGFSQRVFLPLLQSSGNPQP
ncbi:MAG: LuxR C-terminal-related transcriptional regulator [Thermoflexales bacterium]